MSDKVYAIRLRYADSSEAWVVHPADRGRLERSHYDEALARREAADAFTRTRAVAVELVEKTR